MRLGSGSAFIAFWKGFPAAADSLRNMVRASTFDSSDRTISPVFEGPDVPPSSKMSARRLCEKC